MEQAMAAKGFDVRPRFVDEPALWCWEIYETASGQPVDTSWSSEWTAYDSPGDALAAGQRRLAALAGRRPE